MDVEADLPQMRERRWKVFAADTGELDEDSVGGQSVAWAAEPLDR